MTVGAYALISDTATSRHVLDVRYLIHRDPLRADALAVWHVRLSWPVFDAGGWSRCCCTPWPLCDLSGTSPPSGMGAFSGSALSGTSPSHRRAPIGRSGLHTNLPLRANVRVDPRSGPRQYQSAVIARSKLVAVAPIVPDPQ